ncbi:MAG: hypothetical protein ACYC91_07635 [Solirubrobacteraceae bacterium]
MIRAWRTLPPERRLAAYASVGLFVTLFLPWYQETVVAVGLRQPISSSASVTGWQAFSFVEAAVLLVAASVLTLLFQRAEGHAFHLPGGDGWAITAAGFWTCVLVIWRIFDKQSVAIRGPGTEISGIEWGIFFALAVAVLLTYAGSRIRAARQAEPPLPGEEDPFAGQWPSAEETVRGRPARSRRTRERSSWRPAEQPQWQAPPDRTRLGPDGRPVGWLSAPRSHGGSPAAAGPRPPAAAGPRPPAGAGPATGDQLTIPFEPRDPAPGDS